MNYLSEWHGYIERSHMTLHTKMLKEPKKKFIQHISEIIV